jgi:Transposase C of IS166 homeodomain/zinc-finger binding domain of transposase IS66
MRFDLENLPSDTALLHRLVREMAVVVDSRDGEIERLQLIIKKLQRAQFGRRSERLDTDQLALALEDLDGDIARIRESRPAIATETDDTSSRRKPLPDHLPREDVVLAIDGDTCGCCGGALHTIGQSVSEMLDWVPAQLRVVRITRPKICLAQLQQGRASGGAGTADRRWTGHASSARTGHGQQILRSHATLSAIANLRSSPRRSRTFDAGRMGRRRMLVAGSTAGAIVQSRVRL